MMLCLIMLMDFHPFKQDGDFLKVPLANLHERILLCSS